jgi:hypothetical protein
MCSRRRGNGKATADERRWTPILEGRRRLTAGGVSFRAFRLRRSRAGGAFFERSRDEDCLTSGGATQRMREL